MSPKDDLGKREPKQTTGKKAGSEKKSTPRKSSDSNKEPPAKKSTSKTQTKKGAGKKAEAKKDEDKKDGAKPSKGESKKATGKKAKETTSKKAKETTSKKAKETTSKKAKQVEGGDKTATGEPTKQAKGEPTGKKAPATAEQEPAPLPPRPKGRVTRYVVLSDLHLGMAESATNNAKVLRGLASYLADLGSIKTVIFNGDLLDLTLSTFEHAVEGGGEAKLTGLRQLVSAMFRQTGPGKKVTQWVYVPGNHDFRVWDHLSARRNYIEPLDAGKRLRKDVNPPLEGTWKRGEAFIAGVFPKEHRKRVTVTYPEHIIASPKGDIVVTHGHYLDPKQSLRAQLNELIKEEGGDEKRAVRRLYAETTAFQTVAGCASFTEWSRSWINLLMGPSTFKSWFFARAASWFGPDREDLLVSPLRGQTMDAGMLSALELYLKYFRTAEKLPGYVVLGHTHVPGQSNTALVPKAERLFPGRDIAVHNSGSFYPSDDAAASFLVVEVPRSGEPYFLPVFLSESGKVTEGRPEQRVAQATA